MCPNVCDPMNRSIPGLPVHHQIPEFTQTHVQRVSDANKPSHPMSSPSPPAPNASQHQGQWVNSSHEVAKVLEFLSFSVSPYLFIYFYTKWFLLLLLLFFFTLQYCIGFAIHQHASAMGVHVLPIPNPPLTSLHIPFFLMNTQDWSPLGWTGWVFL